MGGLNSLPGASLPAKLASPEGPGLPAWSTAAALRTLSRAIEQTPQAVMITAVDGTIEYVNPAFTASTGYASAEVVGRNPRLLKSGGTAPEVYAGMWRTLRAGQVWRGELVNRRKDGRTFTEFAVIAPVADDEGRVTHYVAIKDDITEERLAAQRTAELAATNREVRALLQANPDLVLRLTAEGGILYHQLPESSPALAAQVRDPGDGGPVDVSPALRVAAVEAGREALARGATFTGETDLPGSDGALAVELRAAPVPPDQFVVFVRDIRDRRRAEEEMAAALRKEREVAELKARFVAVASHEFRTPMAALLASADLLASQVDRLSPGQRGEIAARIHESLRRMTEMLDDLLTVNRMESRETHARPEPVPLDAFLGSLLEEVRAGDAAGHVLEFHGAGPDAVVSSDPSLLHPVVSNLLTNAVRYSAPGSRVVVHAEAGPAGFRVAVRDEGIGIPPADLGRIFEPFERGSNVGRIKGTGLGLNIVQRMTGLLGGTVAVDSVVGGGSTFTLTFPPVPPAPEVQGSHEDPDHRGRGRHPPNPGRDSPARGL